ncbi:unnamed protein product, partial [Iphiclides podalirius]
MDFSQLRANSPEEDVEEIKTIYNTDSQKSVTTSNVYSADFTDNNSDKNNSSGKETYVIDWYDSDDSEASCRLHREESSFNVTDKVSQPLVNNMMQCTTEHQISEALFSNPPLNNVTFIAQETFTQTSKTIIELAKSEGLFVKSTGNNTLQTQTSYVSITDSKRIEYKILSSNVVRKNSDYDWHMVDENQVVCPILSNCLEDKSSKLPESESDEEKSESESSIITRAETQNTNVYTETLNKFEASESSSTDFDDDSLMDESHDNNGHRMHEALNPISDKNSDICDTPKSIGDEVDDLYNKMSNCLGMLSAKKNAEPEFSQWTGALTPLTEESTMKKESIMDISPCLNIVTETNEKVEDMNNCIQDTQIELLSVQKESCKSGDPFKLPPIQKNKSSPSTLNFLLSVNRGNQMNNASTHDSLLHTWEIRGNNLAAGENQFINPTYSSRLPNEVFQLPPIQMETGIHNIYTNYTTRYSSSSKLSLTGTPCESININDKIRELKMSDVRTRRGRGSRSPSITSSPDDSKLGDVALKGCEALCAELMRKLRSTSWCEILDTLEEIPRVMEKFWNVIAELRIADLIRQVTVHVDSPRSQVARTACMTLACILKNTNYTRKPDFYEAVTALLVKTGSFSRPVRRAANMALDDIVCSVDFTHAVTALCVHGVGHKSPLVRCASARLLVVCCAVSGGGRGLLRGRPPTAAAARRAALRALADLLQDKATDARKYAERLYVMLRPLANFEAYFLTDVDVEVATRQMKKCDQLLPLVTKDRMRGTRLPHSPDETQQNCIRLQLNFGEGRDFRDLRDEQIFKKKWPKKAIVAPWSRKIASSCSLVPGRPWPMKQRQVQLGDGVQFRDTRAYACSTVRHKLIGKLFLIYHMKCSNKLTL